MNVVTHQYSQILARTMLTGRADAHLPFSESRLADVDRVEATDHLIADLKAASDNAPGVYLSTPITGGTRLYGFLKEHGKHSKAELTSDEKKAYEKEVIAENCGHAHQVAEELRSSGKRVAEPSIVSFPGWTQTNYNRNWTEVVHEVPFSQVHVCEGWQLSYGCLLEVRTALDRGLPVTDEKGQILNRNQALERVRHAMQDARTDGFEVPALTRALTDPTWKLPMEM